MRATIQGVEVDGTPDELAQLIRVLGSPAAPVKRGPGRPPKAASAQAPALAPAPKAPPKPVSAEVAKARKLQGSYMGLTRQLSKTQQATIKKLRETKGIEATIAGARQMAEAKGKK